MFRMMHRINVNQIKKSHHKYNENKGQPWESDRRKCSPVVHMILYGFPKKISLALLVYIQNYTLE